MGRKNKQDQLFIRDGRRTHRKQFSMTELRLGVLVVLALALVALWVAWRGRHPDPALYSIPLESLQGQMQVERAPMPESLAGEDWQEGPLARFGWDNLYVKINGREGFYKSFGFETLTFLSLSLENDPTTSIDIELFDQGSMANALGTYAAERPAEIVVESDDEGMFHRDRNALYMTRGRYYIRIIGSDESAVVLQQIEHLRLAFLDAMSGADWPWAFALFVTEMNVVPGDVAYLETNAFSYGFASNVWVTAWDDFELFLVPNKDLTAAQELSGRFASGFLDLGERVEGSSPVAWVRDRYLSAISGTAAQNRWVLGVRGAPDVASAEAALQELANAVRRLPDTVLQEAWASVPAPAGSEAADTDVPSDGSPEGY